MLQRKKKKEEEKEKKSFRWFGRVWAFLSLLGQDGKAVALYSGKVLFSGSQYIFILYLVFFFVVLTRWNGTESFCQALVILLSFQQFKALVTGF